MWNLSCRSIICFCNANRDIVTLIINYIRSDIDSGCPGPLSHRDIRDLIFEPRGRVGHFKIKGPISRFQIPICVTHSDRVGSHLRERSGVHLKLRRYNGETRAWNSGSDCVKSVLSVIDSEQVPIIVNEVGRGIYNLMPIYRYFLTLYGCC